MRREPISAPGVKESGVSGRTGAAAWAGASHLASLSTLSTLFLASAPSDGGSTAASFVVTFPAAASARVTSSVVATISRSSSWESTRAPSVHWVLTGGGRYSMRRRSPPALFGERLAWMQVVIAYTPPRAPLRVSADDN